MSEQMGFLEEERLQDLRDMEIEGRQAAAAAAPELIRRYDIRLGRRPGTLEVHGRAAVAEDGALIGRDVILGQIAEAKAEILRLLGAR